ncbi:MAG: hypothetical protein AAFO91_00230 [Bacteroidota bacterium]
MMIPVYLTDENGSLITDNDGVGITVGAVQSGLFTLSSGQANLTFQQIIEEATLEDRQKVLKGIRLAKPIRGRLSRFEIGGTEHNAYVKYNHRIFGGRFESEYTALGSVVGTYLRRGGTAFSKELVEAALVEGPFARFDNFPSSPKLPGDISFTVTAGGGVVSAYAWTITNGSGTTFSPTGASVTETLTAGTWTVSCVVTIDSTPVIVSGQTLEIDSLVASNVTSSNSAPTAGESVLFGLTVNNDSLLGNVAWSVEMEVA